MATDPNSPTAKSLFAPAEPITNTRDRITAAALEAFYEHGFHAVALDAILRDVGVTKTTFYNHFESKDDLAVAAIEMRDRWESESFRRTVAHFTDGTPRGTILAFFDALDLWFNGPEYEGCLFIHACAEFPSQHDPVHKAAAAHLAKSGESLIELTAQAGADDPRALTKQLELLLQGTVVFRLTQGDNDAAKTARATAEALLDRYCSTPLDG